MKCNAKLVLLDFIKFIWIFNAKNASLVHILANVLDGLDTASTKFYIDTTVQIFYLGHFKISRLLLVFEKLRPLYYIKRPIPLLMSQVLGL